MAENFAERKASRIRLDAAVQAFRETERVRFLLEQKENRLLRAISQLELKDRAEYFDQSSSILEEYNSKRKKRGF